MNINIILKVLFFWICLLPISYNGLSINYIFFLTPIIFLLLGHNLILPTSEYFIFITFFSLIFIFSIFLHSEYLVYFDRKIISYLIFVLSLNLCFIKFNIKDVHYFKVAIILASLTNIIYSLTLFIFLGESANSYESKDLIGSNRYGFIYIIAFWIVFFDKKIFMFSYLKESIIFLLVIGICFTFSRATIVSFTFSFFVYSLLYLGSFQISLKKKFKFLLFFLVLSFCSLVAISAFAPVLLTFYADRIIDYVMSGGLATSLSQSDHSDGIRLIIWSNILNYIADNPLLGSGFLGFWVLNLKDFGFSAHNQYLDVLFRTGILGFIVYSFLIYRIYKFSKSFDKSLYYGLIGILLYGLFHETFKESQGAFIFSFLISLAHNKFSLSNEYITNNFNYKRYKNT